ncbi:MAG: YjgP/YjgQ family permease [candidate division Zixibacteria bacterium]|nr:YjgP/YjgQ family permease [candidate division Zixibacteria bacterium]
MKTASRYILKEHIGPFFFGMAVITFVLIMDFVLDILNLIISKGLPALVILEVFVLNLAWMLALSVPMSVLVAVLMAFGRMSADNEITAFKSCGVSFYRLIFPVIVASALLALLIMWFNDRILPESNHRARLLMSDITHKKPAWNLEPGVFLDNVGDYHILVREVEEDQIHVHGVTIYDRKDRETPRTIVAKHGTISFMEDQSTLKIDLFDGEIHEPDKEKPSQYRRLAFKNQSIYIQAAGNQLIRRDSEYRGDREQSVAMMKETIGKTNEKIEKARRNLLTKAIHAFQKVSESPEMPKQSSGLKSKDVVRAAGIFSSEIKSIYKQSKYEIQNINNFERQHNSILVEIHKKFSIPFACIVFVLLGGPLGVMARRGGMGTGLGLSLLFFVLYWAFLIEGEDLADRQFISAFWAMWSANIILGSTGIYLLYKTVQETTFISLHIPGFIKRLFKHR